MVYLSSLSVQAEEFAVNARFLKKCFLDRNCWNRLPLLKTLPQILRDSIGELQSPYGTIRRHACTLVLAVGSFVFLAEGKEGINIPWSDRRKLLVGRGVAISLTCSRPVA